MELPFLKFFKKEKGIPELEIKPQEIEIQDIVAPSAVEIRQNYLKLGERYCKTFFVFSYPRYLSTGWLSPAINLNHPLDISLHIHPVDSGMVLKQLVKKLTEVQAELAERAEKGLVRDPTLETAYQDIEKLRDQLQTARERVFRLGVYITIYGDSEKELRRIETILRSIFESRLIYLKPALMRTKQGFISTLPYGLDQIMVHTPMNTAPLSSIFPFVSPDLSANEGILYGINQHNNSLVLFDRFTLENANMVVFAKSGSGKSIIGSEKVLIKDKSGKIQLTKIGPLIERVIKEQGIDFRDKELEGKIFPGIYVWTFDKNLKGHWGKVKIAARKKAPKVFYRFKTKSGREITTTGDHNLVILKEGKVVVAKSSEVKEGEYIPLPREISQGEKNSPRFINLLSLLRNSKNIYVKGAKELIQQNYNFLKETVINPKLDKYLYRYRNGQLIPIKYFWQIKKRLKTISSSKFLTLSLVSQRGKGELPALLKISPELLKLLGYISSEGTFSKNSIIISNLEKETIKDIETCLKKLNILYFRPKDKRSININTSCFVQAVKALGGGEKSGEKKIYPFLFNLKKELIAKYLSAYFEGDGGVEEDRIQISATSKSKRLISEIAYLLLYFGIIGRISKVKKKPTNCNWKRKRVYWTIFISGQTNLKRFAKYINFISSRKRQKLAEICKKNGNTNVDVIPEIKSIFEEISQLFSCQLHQIQDISALKREAYNPSPEKLKEIIRAIEERIQRFKDLISTFKILSELPSLAEIVDLGKNNQELNRKLWRALGQSWRLMKNGEVKPRMENVFRAIETVSENSFEPQRIKHVLHLGFKEMNLPIKYFNRSLEAALKTRLTSNTRYEMIQKAAQYIWQNYQDILFNKIPKVEKRLSQLKILANSDLFWDPIIEIKKIENKKEEYVYDLTCENGVFLAGEGGMFVHNSYFCKLEILRYLMQGVDVIVIDPENEYKWLAEAVGGSYFNISLNSPHHLNPFTLPTPREDETPADVLRSNVINLVGLFRIMLGGLTPKEDAIIDRALTETYAAKDITPESDPSTWKEKIPLMSDFESVLEGMEGAESLVERVRKYTKGSYAQFFNNPSNVSMDKNFVVFGVRDMEDELRPMAMFIILRHIWNTIRARLKKRILLVDEAWWIMQSEDGASFLYGICKRARKYWLGVSTITQDVNDFMKSMYGQPIITNSALQFLMKQSPATIDVVQKTFNLTDEEKYLLLECAVGEGIFIAGQKRVALKVVASYAEDQIITTSPEQVLKAKRAKKRLKA